MPNWCHNVLRVSGSEKDLHKWVERAASSSGSQISEQPLYFEAFYPVPFGVYDELRWCSRNWGTKWDACFSAPLVGSGKKKAFLFQEGQVTYRFDTAWAPPTPWLEYVAEKYPVLEFSLIYGEPGMGFGGNLEYSGGSRSFSEEGYAEDYLPKSEMWF